MTPCNANRAGIYERMSNNVEDRSQSLTVRAKLAANRLTKMRTTPSHIAFRRCRGNRAAMGKDTEAEWSSVRSWSWHTKVNGLTGSIHDSRSHGADEGKKTSRVWLGSPCRVVQVLHQKYTVGVRKSPNETFNQEGSSQLSDRYELLRKCTGMLLMRTKDQAPNPLSTGARELSLR